jgi:transposase-like protein
MEGKSMSTHRRQYSAEFKAKLVLEVISGEKTPSEVCRTHKLNLNVLARWRQEFVEQAPTIFERDTATNQEQERIAELERLVGQLTMKLEIAKKASGYLSGDKNGR